MATIKIAVDGRPAFVWTGTAVDIERIMTAFPDAAWRVGLAPQALADNCIHHLQTGKGKLLGGGQVAQEMQMMGVLWRILQAETGHPEHPGTIADYAGSVDFLVNLMPHGGQGFTADITATGHFDA